MIDPEDPLPIEILRQQLPQAHWEPQASGTQINPSAVADLERLWTAHVASVRTSPPSPPAQGQGRRLDAILRKEIEDLAQDRLTAFYEEDGWDVEDLRFGNPFDAKATKDGSVVYLEAKGTTSTGDRVIVTRNEVDFARIHPGQCVMGIVSGIRVDSNGKVDQSSGDLRLYAWEPEENDLSPLSYDFFPPAEKRL